MDLADAIARATQQLRVMEDPGLPLRLIDPEGDHVERSWCYAFGWNSTAYLDEDRISAMIPAGLLVVPKDGATPFVLPSALPDDQALDQQERVRGLR